MKVRKGFVSNSSSSSFVVRGIEMKKEDVADCLGVQRDDVEDMSELYEKIWNILYKQKHGYGKGALTFEDTRDFFDGEETETMIIGITLATLDDGCVCQLPEPDDEKIREKIGKILDKEIVEQLHTYVQYISNDNY